MAITFDTKFMIIGGHMTPAFAVIDELKERGFQNICWVGQQYSQVGDSNLSAEYKVVISKEIKFIPLVTGKLFRVWNSHSFRPAIKSLINIPKGIWQAFRIVKNEKPNIVVSFGGYLAVPIAIAAKLYNIPIVTHEQTQVPGLSNRIISKIADKTLISFTGLEQKFDIKKTVFTGNPIRNAIYKNNTQLLNFYNALPIIYITGGNQGSHSINDSIFKLIPTLIQEFNIVHQTGSSSITQDYEKAILVKANLPIDVESRYMPLEFVGELNIGEVFSKSSLIITRAGLNTTLEILATNKHAIVLPLPTTSGNEQLLNAKLLEKTGHARLLEERNLSPENLNKLIFECFEYIRRGQNMRGENFENSKIQGRLYVKPDAAVLIVDELLNTINLQSK